MNVSANSRSRCIVISSMGPGGAERVVSLLANYWAEQGTPVYILTLSKDPSFYRLSSLVEHRALDLLRPAHNSLRGIYNTVRRISRLRREIKRTSADVVISFMDKTNVLVLLAGMSLKTPIVVCERIFPGSYNMGRGWYLLRKLVYPSAAVVVAVTKRMQDKLKDLGFSNVAVIPNPVSMPTAPVRSKPTTNVILGVGRLCSQKGFDTLIRAFSEVYKRHPDWRLRILGDGDDRELLEKVIKECGLDPCVDLPGLTRDIYSELRQAEIFVLSSRYEGFPNVLVEAMSVGRAVLATDCKSGPDEIITHEKDGLLTPVDDASQMAQALCRLIEDPELRRTLGANAEAVVARFDLDATIIKWDRVIEKSLQSRM